MEVYSSVRDPNGVVHRWVFEFERAFFDRHKYQAIEQWMYQWWWIAFPYAALYIVAVFLGQDWMKRNNYKFELRFWLVTWNTLLSIFSLWGALRSVPELVHIYSICDPSYKKGVTGLWLVIPL
jgi:hypothetical protein